MFATVRVSVFALFGALFLDEDILVIAQACSQQSSQYITAVGVCNLAFD